MYACPYILSAFNTCLLFPLSSLSYLKYFF
nr:MAG TPA: hypothetical protein [Caudoviricetes sp.]